MIDFCSKSYSKENNGKELLSVVILGDSDILQLPLEAMAIFEQDSIASVVRDFSLQILYHRIQVFNSVDEEGQWFNMYRSMRLNNKKGMSIPTPCCLFSSQQLLKYTPQ